MTAAIGKPGTLMSANAWMPGWRGPRGAVPVLLLAIVIVGVREAAGAVIPVTTREQKISSTGGCSLQEAIYSANFDHNVAIAGYNGSTPVEVTTQCVPGNGDDIIVLPAGAVLRLNKIVDDHLNPTGPTATPIITSNITILAYGATLQRTGSQPFRLFAVGSSGHLTIRRAFIKDFWARGGDGGRGGGGGMGAGGAIYVVDGVLVVEASTFAGNAATGGKGGVGRSGGGGGVGGNGGPPCFFSVLRGGTGGGGARGNGAPCSSSIGGGGGGTVSNGSRTGGFACGGNGGDASETDPFFSGTGQGGQCAGGGGGGGGEHFSGIIGNDGGKGAYGGGGGGGAQAGGGYGGSGGFGGGGGASGSGGLFTGGKDGGNGGFGGGGGGGAAGAITDGDGGNGGFFGGDGGDSGGGGGGAGLGGAIFNDNGTVVVRNSTFAGNSTQGGFSEEATDGVTGGGAIFSRNGHLSVLNTTISGGLAHIGGGILLVQDSEGAPTSFDLQNSIIANNGDKECAISGFSIAASFVGNLIESNAYGSEFKGRTFVGCPGVVTSDDPQLGPLQYNDGATPTMAISSTSPARDAADPAASLPVDQRRQERPAMGGFDIGAFELCLEGSGKLQMPCPIIFGPESGQEVQLTIDVAPPGGGTTLPAPGVRQVATDSVVALNAAPSPGFRFTEWSQNVTNPGQPSTTVFMDMPQIVIANFAACSCATDVSGSISVARGPFVLNPVTRRYAQTVTLTNTSAVVIAAPISLVLDNLSSTATLYNATGVTQDMLPAGRPYIDGNISLGPGQSGSITLQFTGASTSAISYDTRVLAGPGSR